MIHVVEQGKWNTHIIIVHIAVILLQPLLLRRFSKAETEDNSAMLPWDIYDIIITGITISLAGNPRKNAESMVPSNPKALPKGSRKSVIYFSML